MANGQGGPRFVICIANDGCDDLEVWKLYRILPDEAAARDEFLRVVDDSGEDYLYPARRFVVVNLPDAVEQQLLAVAPSGFA